MSVAKDYCGANVSLPVRTKHTTTSINVVPGTLQNQMSPTKRRAIRTNPKERLLRPYINGNA